MVHMLHLMGVETGIDLDRLVEAARLAEGLIGHPLPGRVMRAGKAYTLHPVPAALAARAWGQAGASVSKAPGVRPSESIPYLQGASLLVMMGGAERRKMEGNRLCELLGIRYPVIQAPMNWVSGADLAAAVSNAGGLGTLGPNAGARTITSDVELTGDRLRQQIRKVRSLTKNPFAVNIAIGVGGQRQYSQRCVEVAIEEGVPVAISSVGSPEVYTRVLKGAGIKALHAISTARHAQKAEEVGVDGVICEGYEAGGHKGFTELTTLVLVPMVADTVRIPVVAGGGIGDARGLLAALVLGADGVYMGTRFMATLESESHPQVKEAIVRGADACTVSLPKDIMLARDLRNQFTQKYLEMKAAGASPKQLADFLNGHSQYHAQVLGDCDGAEVCCGQVAGLIERVVSAAEVIQGIVDRIPSTLQTLQQKVGSFKTSS